MSGKLAFGLYCGVVGYYVARTDLDKDIAEVAKHGYDLMVLHTMQVVRRGQGRDLAGEPRRAEVPA